jgi:parallel beta-helix repeat protein
MGIIKKILKSKSIITIVILFTVFLVISFGENQKLLLKVDFQDDGEFILQTHTISPILINGNAELAAFCSVGSGTEANPYQIANLTINGNYLTNPIEIANTDLHYIIENCTLSESGGDYRAGIKIRYSNNVIVRNNTCFGNEFGIWASGGENVSIIDNDVHSNADRGIFVNGVDFVEVSYNKVVGHMNGLGHGISNAASDFGNFSHNIILDAIYGIFNGYQTGSSTTNNSISSNYVSECHSGIYDYGRNSIINWNECENNNWNALVLGGGASNCIIANNTFQSNSQQSWNPTIRLVQGAINNIFYGNFIVNTSYCLNLYECYYNHFYNNTFQSNDIQVKVNIGGYNEFYDNTFIQPKYMEQIQYNTAFYNSYNMNESIEVEMEIDSYEINDISAFTIDSNGIVTNISTLTEEIYFIEISASTTNGNLILKEIIIDIIYPNDNTDTSSTFTSSTSTSDATSSGTSSSDTTSSDTDSADEDPFEIISGFSLALILPILGLSLFGYLIIAKRKIHKLH